MELIEDLGDKERRLLFTTPRIDLREQDIPKKRSGKWVSIWNHGFKIAKSLTTDRIFVFDLHGEFLCELESVELYNLCIRGLNSIGAFREEIRTQKGYRWITYVLKPYRRVML